MIKNYNFLPGEAIRIREDVFMKEQGFEEEFDSIDEDDSFHLVYFIVDMPVATCRYFYDTQKQSYIIGRIAVTSGYRGQGIGTELIQEAERLIRSEGGGEISLSAQLQAVPFYENLGYETVGEPYKDEHCLHTWMTKTEQKK